MLARTVGENTASDLAGELWADIDLAGELWAVLVVTGGSVTAIGKSATNSNSALTSHSGVKTDVSPNSFLTFHNKRKTIKKLICENLTRKTKLITLCRVVSVQQKKNNKKINPQLYAELYLYIVKDKNK